MKEKKQHVRRKGRPLATEVGDTREELLNAATRLFSEQGVAATSMSEIAVSVGVTSAMIHYYFKNRERLLEAVVEERIGVFFELLHKHVKQNDDSAVMVRGLVEVIVRATVKMPWLPPLWIREIANEGGQLRERLMKILPHEIHQQFSECIAKGQKAGTVNRNLHPHLLFISIIGQTLFVLAVSDIWRRFPVLDNLSTQEFIDHVTSLLTYGLAGSA